MNEYTTETTKTEAKPLAKAAPLMPKPPTTRRKRLEAKIRQKAAVHGYGPEWIEEELARLG